MGNVGKRATMHNGWRIFGCLHQIGLYGIFEQHHDSTSHTKVLNSEGLAVIGIAQEYVLDATAQVGLVLCKTKNGHQLRCGGYIETSLLCNAIGCRTESGNDRAERTVVDIEHATPKYFAQAEAFLLMLVKVVVEQGSYHIVSRGDGMEVASEVQIDTFHWQHLGISATCCTALHAEARTKRRLAQRHTSLLAYGIKTKGKTNAHSRLATAGTCGRNGCYQDELAFFLLINERKGQFGNVLAIVFDGFGVDAQLLCYLVNALELCAVRNFDICLH